MRIVKSLFLRFLFWPLALASGVAGQSLPLSSSNDEKASVNYGFVSPNVKENLNLAEAKKRLNSDEEWLLIRRVSELACRLRSQPTTARAIGSWSDGAEHSVLIRIKANEPTMRYLVASLGKETHQKSVLYFHRQDRGSARLYILDTTLSRRLETVARTMDHAGILFRTLVPRRTRMTIFVVDTERRLHAQVRTAARALRARLRAEAGKAEFIGDNQDREIAARAFDNLIRDYEASHPALPRSCREARSARDAKLQKLPLRSN